MTATIDKFGRIVIPKKIRKLLNLEPGSNVELVVSDLDAVLEVKKVQEVEPVLFIDELGIPTFNFQTDEIFHYDFVAAIKEGREERDRKITDA